MVPATPFGTSVMGALGSKDITMFDAGALTFREFATNEPLLLANIQNAVLEFLRGRDDSVVCGAQGVNGYVAEARMTQDVDLLSTCAKELAEELREHLTNRFQIEIRIRKIGEGLGYRLFQIQKSGNRHQQSRRSWPYGVS